METTHKVVAMNETMFMKCTHSADLRKASADARKLTFVCRGWKRDHVS